MLKKEKIERRAKRSTFQHNLDVNLVRYLYSHELPQGPLVRAEIYQALVNAHLPVVPGFAALAIRGFPDRNSHFLRGQRYGSVHLHACSLGDVLDLVADVVEFLRLGAGK